MNVTRAGAPLTGRTFVMPQPGDVVAGKYTILRVLGEGGMGIVYEATHQRLRQRVALKMLLPAMLEHDVVVSRFEREARAAAQLRGRHCARVKDVDVTADGLPYMVMDLLEGHDLEVELQRRGRLSVHEAADFVLQACAAMEEAHQLGIVHRDLKPSNLFLEREPVGGVDVRVVKVLDFGISKVAASEGDAKLTDVDAMMGTALYMSPEQVKASHAVDARADIWALGVILFEALSGRVPWTGGTAQVAAMIVTEDPPDLHTLCRVPAQVAAIVERCLQRDPRRRFQHVRELAAALAPFAPPGSAGRVFADGAVAAGSVAVRPSTPVGFSPSIFPARGADESARTLLDAPGVGQEMMRPRELGTAPGWSQRPAASGRGRAALLGVVVAFVIGLVCIGSVALFFRRSSTRAAAPASSSTTTDASSVEPASVTAAAHGPSSSPPAIEPPPSVKDEGAPPSAKDEGAPPSAKDEAPPKVTTAPARSARPPGSAKPSAPPRSTASAQDKPLFL